MIKITLICLLFIVSGCSSTPKPQTKYFVLTPDTQSTSTAVTKTLENDSREVIVIEAIKLAEFLDQPGIIQQKDAHQIEIAHYHRWGEPLKRNLHRYFLETLTNQLPQYNVQYFRSNNEEIPSLSLLIYVNQFHGTTAGSALFSGNWILSKSGSETQIINAPFSYQTPLTDSGFPALVNQLAQSLDQLCGDIAKAVNNK